MSEVRIMAKGTGSKKSGPKPAQGGNSKYITPPGKHNTGSIGKGGSSKVTPSSGRAGGSARGK